MKAILVTGANKGIGLAIVTKLLEDFPDTYILLGSRNVARGREALQHVVRKLGYEGKNRVDLLQLDVTSDESIRDAVNTVKKMLGDKEPLYGLVNNAGGMSGTPREILELNTYSLRRVTEAFLPLIRTDQGRIVQLSSGAAPSFVKNCSPDMQALFVDKQITWEQLEKKVIKPFMMISEDLSLSEEEKAQKMMDHGLSKQGLGGYGLSKACVNSYTIELAQRFPSMLINSCSPGFIATDLTRPFAERSGKRDPQEVGALPVEKGTIAPNYLMMGNLMLDIPDYESGRFYGSDAKRSPLHKSRSPGDPVYDGTFP